MTEEKSIIDLAQGRGPQAPEGAPSSEENTMRPHERAENHKGDKTREMSNILNSLLENVQDAGKYIDVELPSRGLVQLRPFNYEDEKVLRSVKKGQNAQNVLTNLIGRCVKDLDVNELGTGDFTFLLFKLRELSYGDNYKITVECEDCGEKNELEVQLSKLNVNYADENYSKPIKVLLPDSKKTATLRRPKIKDAASMDDLEKLMNNLWRFVTDIEGHSDRMLIQNFIKKTTVRDVATVREALLSEEVGLDTAVRFLCRACESDTSVALPMTADFFTVS
jgi:hypothetical protein